jgi:ABC-2 type transport system permease protein
MTGISTARSAAVARKELAEFRRSRFIVITMGVFPAIFLILPIVQILTVKTPTGISPQLDKRIGLSLLYLTLVPVVVPSATAGYSVIGERDQGTLEPLLATPLSRAEFILGKAAAIFLPAVGISYVMYGIYLIIVQFGAQPALATAVYHAPQLWAAIAFTPLLCGWSIWIGLAISSKVSDTRIAQQLTMLASLPPVALTALMSLQVINATLTVVLSLAAALLAVDSLAWIFVAQLFDRERLVTGTKATGDTAGAVP